MARREITQYFDDLDNTPLNEDEIQIVEFSVNGTDYILDLSQNNRAKFDEALAPFVSKARKNTRSTARRNGRSASSARGNSPELNKRIREWAQENGLEVSSRGRISSDVVEAFEKAHA